MNIQWERAQVGSTTVEGNSVVVRGEFESAKGKGEFWVRFDAEGKVVEGGAKEKGGFLRRLLGR